MFWMLLASSLGFVKLIALAFVLDVQDYGLYVSIFGLSTLAGAIVSFGRVESTIKSYPRKWADGYRQEILVDAGKVSLSLVGRFIFIAIVGFIACSISNMPFSLIEVACFSALGLGSVVLSLMASLFRAVGSKNELQNFSVWRSGGACLLALSVGWHYGWLGVLTGDIISSILTIGYAVYRIRCLFSLPVLEAGPKRSCSDNEEKSSQGRGGHGKLYAANMLSASTAMADRAWVNGASGATAAGSYGVIMLLPQVFQMFVNVLSQYVGPLLIKIVHLRGFDDKRARGLMPQLILLTLLSFLCVCGIEVGRHIPLFSDFYEKFSLTTLSIIGAGVISVGQIYSLMEFHLIAHDGERHVFFASLLTNLLIFALFSIVSYMSLRIDYFVVSVAICRWLQVLILTNGLLRVRGGNNA